ncbi:cilia- and flagella-associated protein 58-like isoform X2 [Aphis gossypii]|uniref:cilia- and flagella-associated protein 58-like isoform X2 n=1 Tax=Aphis gossypii TaxID=80765 RepID=UPI002158CE9F|nr:cilia- and flagella-associated protein 58-like isoform X2 [Aphis gossypii]
MEINDSKKPESEYKHAIEFVTDPPLTEALAHLWAAVRKLGEESVKCIEEKKSLTRIMDNYRQLMPEIKQSILSEQNTVEKLKEELNSAHRMLDASNLREQIIQESNDNLLAQIKTLKTELDSKTKQMEEESLFSSMGQGDTSQLELTRTKRELARMDVENKRLNNLCESLKKELDGAEYNVRDLEADLAAQSNNLVKEIKTKEKLEDRIKTDHDQMEKIKTELGITKNNFKKAESNIEKLNETLKDLKIANNNLNTKNTSYDKQIKKLTRELKIKTELRADSVKEINILQDKINYQENELLRVQSELTRLIATHEASVRKRQEVMEEVDKISKEKKNSENSVTILERSLNTSQEDNVKLKKILELTEREKKLLEKNMTKVNEQITAYIEKMNIKESAFRALEQEFRSAQKYIDKLNQDIITMKNNKEKLHQEIITLKQKINEDSVTLNHKEVEVQELKKEVNNWSDKFKEQDHDLHTIKTERNLFSKNLAESKDETEEIKDKIKMISQQLEQQKEYVAYKEMQLMKNDTVLKQTEKELQKRQQEIDEYETKVEEMSNLLKKKNEDEKSMIMTLKLLQKNIEKLQKQNDEGNKDKNKLINQINKRNEELLKQKDANDILRTTLGKGEVEYNKRMDDIRLLKSEVKSLSVQKNLLMKNLSEINDIRGEVLKYEQKLNRERLKCRALEDILIKPTNVHRWRILKNTDPPAYEMTAKVKILQKRLLEQCTRVFDKDLQVQELQTRYEKLKDEFIKLPGRDIFKEMNDIKRTLLKKDDKMRSLSGELIISQQTTKECMFELERTKKDLNEFKNKYYELKRIMTKIKLKNQNTTALTKRDSIPISRNKFLDMTV